MAYWKVPGAVKHLHTEVHGIDHQQVRPIQPQFGGKIEFALRLPGLADGLEHVALHVEDEHLVAQRVGYVNPLRGGVHGNSGGPFEVTFAAFQTADGTQKFSAGLKDKNHARIGIGYVDVVLGIDRNALRRAASRPCFFPRAR